MYDHDQRAKEILAGLLRNPHTSLDKAFSALERVLPKELEKADMAGAIDSRAEHASDRPAPSRNSARLKLVPFTKE